MQVPSHSHFILPFTQGDDGIFVLFCFNFTNAVMESGQIFHDMVQIGGKEERELLLKKCLNTHTHTHLLTDPPTNQSFS